jgi:hypothetical protein
MKTVEALPESTVVSQRLIKMEKPEGGPFDGVCMYSKTGDGDTIYSVVGHTSFDMVMYEGPSKDRANEVYYRLTSVYDHVDGVSDDEL